MAIETATRSRRALLTGALGAAAALAAQAVGRPLSARAADGDSVILGADDNKSETPTEITSAGGPVLRLWNSGGIGDGLIATHESVTGSAIAVIGTSQSQNGTGVRGNAGGPSPTNGGAIGVHGKSTAPAGVGVRGWASHGTGPNYGVYGTAPSALGTGVYGIANRYGVHGKAGATGGMGVLGEGYSSGSADRGVTGFAKGGQGVRGEAETGIGVYATATGIGGIALSAAGKVHFSRSGNVLFGSGTTSAVVTLGGVNTSSLIFAMIGQNLSGKWVRAVVPGAGSFTIHVNVSLPAGTRVNWFVLD